MGTLRNRIAYRRATEQTAPFMAEIRETFSNFGDSLEHLFDERYYSGPPEEIGEYRRCLALMLTNLELASRDAIKLSLLKFGTPIDNAPTELHRRID